MLAEEQQMLRCPRGSPMTCHHSPGLRPGYGEGRGTSSCFFSGSTFWSWVAIWTWSFLWLTSKKKTQIQACSEGREVEARRYPEPVLAQIHLPAGGQRNHLPAGKGPERHVGVSAMFCLSLLSFPQVKWQLNWLKLRFSFPPTKIHMQI